MIEEIKDVKLHTKLQEKLDNLGITPNEEPEIHAAIAADSKSDLALKLLSEDEIVNEFSAEEIGDFLYAVENRIVGFTKTDGSFKSTPNTENCRLPNFLEVGDIVKLGEKNRGVTDADEIKSNSDELVNKCYAVSGLNIDTLSDWEKNLVVHMVYSSSLNATLHSVGKRFKS